jgi:transcriptional regulator with XRE-family HTH domain
MNEVGLHEELETGFSGVLLRERREARGVSLEEAVEQTRIRRSFIEAMEEDRFGDLPGDAYVVGFLRSYASFLGFDAVEIVERYQQRFKKPVLRKPEKQGAGTGLFRPAFRKRILLAAGLATAALVLLFLIRLLVFSAPDQDSGPAPAVVSETELPVAARGRESAIEQPVAEDAVVAAAEVPLPPGGVSPDQPTAGIPAEGAVLRIEALSAGWLEVAIDDRMVQRYRLEPGTVLSWKIQRVLHLETELPRQVKIWLNESPFDPGDRTALHLGPLPGE